MSAKQPSTYQFPVEIQRRYHQLMNTKQDFLTSRRLTVAERQRLVILYAQLSAAWKENNTEQLHNDLLRISHELRTMQRELEGDFTEFERSVEKELKHDLKMLSQKLKKKSDLEAFDTKIWKDDILERKANLSRLQQASNQTAKLNLQLLKQKLKSLKENLTDWEKAQEQLTSDEQRLQQKKDELSQQREVLSQQSRNFQAWKATTRSKNDSELNEYRLKLSEKLQEPKATLETKRTALLGEQTAFADNLLKQLQQEMLEDLKESPPGLLSYLKQGDTYSISLESAAFSDELNRRRNALRGALSKSGFTEEEFFTLMDKNLPNADST
jgi:chromosome segregation ATPase